MTPDLADLDIRFERSGRRYKAVVVGSPVGEGFEEQFRQPAPPRGAAQRQRFQNREDIFLDGQAPEDRRLLGQIADALPRADVHRIGGQVMLVEAISGIQQAE